MQALAWKSSVKLLLGARITQNPKKVQNLGYFSEMEKLKKTVILETAFGPYLIHEVIGEGGAGRVYGGIGPDEKPVAVKVLSSERLTNDKRRRFKNEIAFLSRNTHPGIVPVIDHGFSREAKISGPFYVMPRYAGSFRGLMNEGIPINEVLPLFMKIMDGVEAAHLQGAVHRDLKPENILYDASQRSPVIADFGVSHFTQDLLVTQVETSPSQRLANFQYAAPEQRVAGGSVTKTADIYALGLILNEMFTGKVPHGTEFPLIEETAPNFAYLDKITGEMLLYEPSRRPATIQDVKVLIQRHQSWVIGMQRLSEINGTVIKEGDIDEPLAHEPPQLVNYDWDGSHLKLILDRPVNQNWVMALHNMPNFGALIGKPPQVFSFNGNEARVLAQSHQIQPIIDHFKAWLPTATKALKQTLEQKAQRTAFERKEMLRKEKELEEERLKVMKTVRI
jgi:serine/threonine protein kinase